MLAVTTEAKKVFSSPAGLGRSWVEHGVCREVAAVFREGRVIDIGVPITALPASDAVTKRIHKVIVIPGKIPISNREVDLPPGKTKRNEMTYSTPPKPNSDLSSIAGLLVLLCCMKILSITFTSFCVNLTHS